MRILIALLILSIVGAGIAAACPDGCSDHCDAGCVGACCQVASPNTPAHLVVMALVPCDSLPYAADALNDDPLLRTLFRPPEVA